METRKCKTCGDSKPIEKFKKTGNYRNRECNSCRYKKTTDHEKQQVAAWAKSNRDHLREYHREWRSDHKDSVNARNRAYKNTNRPKVRAANKNYKKRNPEKVKQHAKTYRSKNRDARIAYSAEWRKNNWDLAHAYNIANREQRAISGKKWREEHPELLRLYQANRRTRKTNAGGKATLQDVIEIFEQQSGLCTGCDVSISKYYEIDHIMPVLLGGSSDPWNLQLLCRRCNRLKSDKHPDEWARIAANLRLKNTPCPDSKPTPKSTATTKAAPAASAPA
jgi:hypothetical protein